MTSIAVVASDRRGGIGCERPAIEIEGRRVWQQQLLGLGVRWGRKCVPRRVSIGAFWHSCRRDRASDEMNRHREALARHVVPGRHRTKFPDPRKEILDLVPTLAHLPVAVPWLRPVPSRGNHRLRPARLDLPGQLLRVEGLFAGQNPERKALKWSGTPARSCAWPGRIVNRTRNPSASTTATILPVRPPPGRSPGCGPPLASAAFW